MKSKKYLFLSLAWFLATIFALFFSPQSHEPPPFAHFDKWVHFALFFGQAWLLAKIFLTAEKKIPFFLIASLCIVWAIGSEFLQATLTLTRNGDYLDMAADIVGVLVALFLAKQVSTAKKKLHSHSLS